MKIKLAILEGDTEYLNRFTAILGSKYMENLQIYTFSNAESAVKTLSETRIDVFLADEQFEFSNTQIPKTCSFAYLVSKPEVEEYKGHYAISKFQKIQTIYKQILNLYAEQIANNSNMVKRGGLNYPIYLFLGASGGNGTTSLAAACATHFARLNKKVIYLNLEFLGDSKNYFFAEGTGNLSDIIFAIKTKKSNINLKIEGNIKTDKSGVNYFDGCETPCDLLELKEEEIEVLFQGLQKMYEPDYIIVDTEFNYSKRTSKLMDYARKIIFVNNGTKIANEKFKKAYQVIEIMEQESDIILRDKVNVVYNQFHSRTGEIIEQENIKVIGGIPFIDGADNLQVIEILSNHEIIDHILE